VCGEGMEETQARMDLVLGVLEDCCIRLSLRNIRLTW